MKIVGIIAEYNPFHNGHQYHLNQTKEFTDADGVICVMSSSFLQRGEPALIDKWERTKMALAGGVDLVIELPMPYALRSAEIFAFGGISLLDATGIVTHVSFGSESGEIEKLNQIAQILAEEPEMLNNLIINSLDQGFSYPSARTKALMSYMESADLLGKLTVNEIESITTSPNNILGLEYLKAIHRLKSPLIPVTIPRLGAEYHEKQIKHTIASATAIRETLWKRNQEGLQLFDEKLLQTMPKSSQKILQQGFEDKKGPIFTEDFSLQILTLLRRADVEDIANLFDVRGGLENRIKEAAHEATSIKNLIERIKTKRFTWTRIQRTIFHFLMNLTSVQCEYFDQLGGPQYIRILGFNPRGQRLLAHMKEETKLPIITRVANYYHRPGTPEPVNRMLELEILTTNLYSLVVSNQEFQRSNRDLFEKVVIWK